MSLIEWLKCGNKRIDVDSSVRSNESEDARTSTSPAATAAIETANEGNYIVNQTNLSVVMFDINYYTRSLILKINRRCSKLV